VYFSSRALHARKRPKKRHTPPVFKIPENSDGLVPDMPPRFFGCGGQGRSLAAIPAAAGHIPGSLHAGRRRGEHGAPEMSDHRNLVNKRKCCKSDKFRTADCVKNLKV